LLLVSVHVVLNMFERLPGSNTSLQGYRHQWEAYVGYDDIFHGDQLYEGALHDHPAMDLSRYQAI